MTIGYDTQHPRPIYTVPLESGRSAVLYDIDFSEYLGPQGSLTGTEWVYDVAEVTVTRDTLLSQSERVLFENPNIGATPDELVADVYLRGVTAGGGVTPPVQFKVTIRPDLGDPV